MGLALQAWLFGRGTQPKYRRQRRLADVGAETLAVASVSVGEAGALQTRRALRATTLGRTGKGDMVDASYGLQVGACLQPQLG